MKRVVISEKLGKVFTIVILFALCSCQAKQVQNPPVQMHKKQQAKIEEVVERIACGNMQRNEIKEFVKNIAKSLNGKMGTDTFIVPTCSRDKK